MALTESAHAAVTPQQLVAAVAADPGLLNDPQTRERHRKLLERSSVCSYCGVGCPYTVEDDARGNPRVSALSPLGLCVKGKTSLLTGGDKERAQRLAKRGLPDDRIRAPMLRGHDGAMHEVSWDEALDRAAWLFLHAREWVGSEAVAVYGNGQKTMEAIWMASLYHPQCLVLTWPIVTGTQPRRDTNVTNIYWSTSGVRSSIFWLHLPKLEWMASRVSLDRRRAI